MEPQQPGRKATSSSTHETAAPAQLQHKCCHEPDALGHAKTKLGHQQSRSPACPPPSARQLRPSRQCGCKEWREPSENQRSEAAACFTQPNACPCMPAAVRASPRGSSAAQVCSHADHIGNRVNENLAVSNLACGTYALVGRSGKASASLWHAT